MSFHVRNPNQGSEHGSVRYATVVNIGITDLIKKHIEPENADIYQAHHLAILQDTALT